MTRGDSAALRAGAGTRASASASAGTSTGTRTAAAIRTSAAITARVNGILGPLGIQRQIGRHRRAKVIRLRASLIGIPTAESVAIARRIGRLDQLAIGRSNKLSVASRPAVGVKGNRPRLDSSKFKQRARIINVVEIARSIGNDRRVTVLVMASRIINLRRLCIAERIAIHATTSRVVDVILAIRAVNGEVHIGLAALNTHQRSSSNTVEASRQRLAVGSSDHRGLTRLQVIENQSRASSRLSADNQIVTRHRRGAQIIRKAQINRLLFTQHALRRKRNHMELSVVRHLIEGRAIGRIGDAVSVRKGAELHGRNDITRCLINALKRTCARRNDGILIRQSRTSPVIALGRVDVLPRNFARGNLNARKGAVAVGRVVILVIRNIDRAYIDVLAVRNDGAGALRQVRQTRRQPLADQLVCSNRLDRTAVERNDDKAIGIDRTRGIAHLGGKRRRGNLFARGRIDLNELVLGRDVHKAVSNDRLAAVGILLTRLGLPIEGPLKTGGLRRRLGIRYGRTVATVAVAGPLGIPIRSRRARIHDNLVGIGHGRIIGGVGKRDLIAALERNLIGAE